MRREKPEQQDTEHTGGPVAQHRFPFKADAARRKTSGPTTGNIYPVANGGHPIVSALKGQRHQGPREAPFSRLSSGDLASPPGLSFPLFFSPSLTLSFSLIRRSFAFFLSLLASLESLSLSVHIFLFFLFYFVLFK